MTVNSWLESFFRNLKRIQESVFNDGYTNRKRTQTMQSVMESIAKDFLLGVTCRKTDPALKKQSREYLNIDFIFFKKIDYDEDNYVLPEIVVEHENSYERDQIAYCLWKLLCIRSPLRILICYQNDIDKLESLRRYLEAIIRENNLMNSDYGNILVVIGDLSLDERDDCQWNEYFRVFQWRNNALGPL